MDDGKQAWTAHGTGEKGGCLMVMKKKELVVCIDNKLQPVEKGHLSVVFFSYKERECGIMVWGCASSVQVIQSGERPDPAKRSEQPVLSLGAGAAR